MVQKTPLLGTHVLFGICAWLGWSYVTLQPVVLDKPIAARSILPPAPITDAGSGPQSAKSETSVATIVGRPIFEVSRRPLTQDLSMDLQEIVIEEPEPEKVTPVQEPVFVPKPVVLPEFHFSGVLILSSRKSALISVENSEPVWVDLNDLILDWKLYAISPNYVELINEDETIRLFLHSDE